MLHPLYRKLLEEFCQSWGLDPNAVAAMAAGRRAIPDEISRLLAQRLDIPASAWRKKTRTTARVPLVSHAPDGHYDTVDDAIDTQLDVRRRKRRLGTSVHWVLDTLGWTVKDLARHVSKQLGRPVSRPSMQFYVTGSRRVKRRTEGSHRKVSTELAVQAPEDVRKAAFEVTRRESLARGLGEAGILRPEAWPNVEPS